MTKNYKIELKKINYQELKEFNFSLMELFDKTKNGISKLNESWDNTEDLRLLVFDHFITSFKNFLFCIILVQDNMTKNVWWKKNFHNTQELSKEMINNSVSAYLDECKIQLIFSNFTHLETFLRDINRNEQIIKKTNEGYIKFRELREEIIDYSGINEEYKCLLELFEHIRNSFHNNGFHIFHDKGIKYNNKIYSLTNEQPIDFINFDFLRMLFEEINSFLEDLINSDKISQLPKIISLYSQIDFKQNENFEK